MGLPSRRAGQKARRPGRGRAVIVRGLAGNERVVRAGVHVLQPGERVRVLQEPDTTNVGGLL